LLLLATLLATVRLFRLYRGDAAKTEEHDDGVATNRMAILLSMQPNDLTVQMNSTQFFHAAIRFGVI
jgi:hypothetical protein